MVLGAVLNFLINNTQTQNPPKPQNVNALTNFTWVSTCCLSGTHLRAETKSAKCRYLFYEQFHLKYKQSSQSLNWGFGLFGW